MKGRVILNLLLPGSFIWTQESKSLADLEKVVCGGKEAFYPLPTNFLWGGGTHTQNCRQRKKSQPLFHLRTLCLDSLALWVQPSVVWMGFAWQPGNNRTWATWGLPPNPAICYCVSLSNLLMFSESVPVSLNGDKDTCPCQPHRVVDSNQVRKADLLYKLYYGYMSY